MLATGVSDTRALPPHEALLLSEITAVLCTVAAAASTQARSLTTSTLACLESTLARVARGPTAHPEVG